MSSSMEEITSHLGGVSLSHTDKRPTSEVSTSTGSTKESLKDHTPASASTSAGLADPFERTEISHTVKETQQSIARKAFVTGVTKSPDALGHKNLRASKDQAVLFMSGNFHKALDWYADDVDASIFSGIFDHGGHIRGKPGYQAFFEKCAVAWNNPGVRDVKMMEPRHFAASEDGKSIYFHADYDFVIAAGKYKGQHWVTTSAAKERWHNGKIAKKMVLVNIPESEKNVVDIDYEHHDFKQVVPNKTLATQNLNIAKSVWKKDEDGRRVWDPTHLSQEDIRANRKMYANSYQAEILSSIVPGGSNIKSVGHMEWFLAGLGDAVTFHKPVEAHTFAVSEDGSTVFWTEDWDVTFKKGQWKGEHWVTSAIGRKVFSEDGKIEKQFVIINPPFECSPVSQELLSSERG